MYRDYHRPYGLEHELQLCLPDSTGLSAGPGRKVRLYLYRGPGPDFSERDRAVLTLLRPHLHQTLLDAERRRHPVPRLTPRQKELLHLLVAGHTNTQIARRVQGWLLARDLLVCGVSVLFSLWITFTGGYQAVYQALVVVLIGVILYAFLNARREDAGQIPDPVDNPPDDVAAPPSAKMPAPAPSDAGSEASAAAD